MARLKLSPPWIEFYSKLEALFAQDSKVHVVFDEENMEVFLYVEDGDTANALTYLLPEKKSFGNVDLKLTILPANESAAYNTSFKVSDVDLIKAALKNNKAVSFIETINGAASFNVTYVVFENRVVQFFNDSLRDYYGLCSTLYENIAREVFESVEGVFFCTDIPG